MIGYIFAAIALIGLLLFLFGKTPFYEGIKWTRRKGDKLGRQIRQNDPTAALGHHITERGQRLQKGVDTYGQHAGKVGTYRRRVKELESKRDALLQDSTKASLAAERESDPTKKKKWEALAGEKYAGVETLEAQLESERTALEGFESQLARSKAELTAEGDRIKRLEKTLDDKEMQLEMAKFRREVKESGTGLGIPGVAESDNLDEIISTIDGAIEAEEARAELLDELGGASNSELEAELSGMVQEDQNASAFQRLQERMAKDAATSA